MHLVMWWWLGGCLCGMTPWAAIGKTPKFQKTRCAALITYFAPFRRPAHGDFLRLRKHKEPFMCLVLVLVLVFVLVLALLLVFLGLVCVAVLDMVFHAVFGAFVSVLHVFSGSSNRLEVCKGLLQGRDLF